MLFSPKRMWCPASELYNFSEISPIQLALLFSYQSADEIEQEEFTFTANCTREQIIDYLFDVEGSEGLCENPAYIRLTGLSYV